MEHSLWEMLNTANRVSENMAQALPTMTVDRESVADTGAMVVCGGTVDAEVGAQVGAAPANKPDSVHCG